MYLRFRRERNKPAYDLICNIDLERPGRMVDLGCGPGNSTALLRDRWPEAEVVGIDSSASMIGKAKDACPGASFLVMDMCEDLARLGPFDLIFANASLQWVSDQGRLLRRMLSLLRPKGVFAAQIPQYDQMPISKVIDDVVSSPEWSGALGEIDPGYHFNPDERYYEWLTGKGIAVQMWATEYYHIMDGHDRIVEMISSTGLRPFLQQLSDEDVPDFIRSITEGLRSAYPFRSDGKVLFPFKRLFVTARKE